MKNFLPFLIIISLFFSQTAKAHGDLDLIGGPIAAGAWASQHAGQAIQIAKAAVSAYADMSLMTKEYVLDPIAKVFGQRAVSEASNSLKNWAKSGFDGDPTFITNPEVLTKNIATNVVRTNIADLSKSNNPASRSIVNALVAKTRDDQAPLSQKIAPSLPSSIQNNVCTDAKLTELAKNYIDAGVSVAGDNSLETIKNNLRTEFNCGGTLSKTGQKKVNDCYANDFNCGGWDSWLKLTSDPNNTLTGQLIATNVATVQKQAEKEKAEDKITVDGTRAITDCVDVATVNYSTNVDNSFTAGFGTEENSFYSGVITDASVASGAVNNPNKTPCQNKEVRTPAKQITDQISKSLGTGLDGLITADEFSEVLTGFVGLQINSLMSEGFSGSNSGMKITLDMLQDPYNITTPTSTPKNTPLVFSDNSDALSADTAGDSSEEMTDFTKNTFTKSMFADLEHVKTLTSQLKDITIVKYLSNLDGHNTRIDELSACYTTASSYETIRPYIDNEKTFINNKRSDLGDKIAKANTTLTGISTLTDFIKNSFNASAINVKYLEYQDKLNYGQYITDIEAERIRQEQVAKEPYLSDLDTYNYQATGNTYKAKWNTCQSMICAMNGGSWNGYNCTHY